MGSYIVGICRVWDGQYLNPKECQIYPHEKTARQQGQEGRTLQIIVRRRDRNLRQLSAPLSPSSSTAQALRQTNLSLPLPSLP